MSTIRTFHTSNEAAYVSLCALISGAAADCASKLARTSIPAYAERRSRIIVHIETTELVDGVVRPFRSGQIPITGWRLKTAPFFLSDPSIDSRGAVFIQRFDETADLVDKDFYGECLAAFPSEMVLPLSEVSRAHTELLQILRYQRS